jgi:predicted phage tail protein
MPVAGSLVVTDRQKPSAVIQGGGGAVGGGKGGGGAGSNVEKEDTLYSVSNARILVAVGEGPLEGPVSDEFVKDLILNGTPLKSPSGDLNFKGFTVEWRNGSEDQDYIPGFNSVEQEVSVGQLVQNGIPVVRSILNANIDAVRVRVRIPALREFRKDGSAVGSEVRYRIDISSNGGPYVTRFSDGLSGKTTSPYDRLHSIRLEGSAPWNIRVVRETPDATSERISNEIYFQALTEVQHTRRRYPNTALISILIDARQFGQIPNVFLNTKGLRILVPHNYDTDNGTYSGFFNGSLRESWTDNPVWVLYDLLTDTRYGARLNPNRIDIASFYEAAVYCDERVPADGGNTERRWTFNGSIETRGQAFNIVEAVAASFHGLMYWSGSKIRLVVDKYKKPKRKFSRENVLAKRNDDGSLAEPPFLYSDTSLSAIHTVANISYREPGEGYQLKTIQYVDTEAVAKYGYRPIDITAFGCTSRTQAYRYGKWRILTDNTQQTTVSFRVAREGMLVGVGDVFHLYDESVLGEVQSGRIVSATMTSITLDVEVGLISGTSYELLTVSASGDTDYAVVSVASSTETTPGKYDTIAIEGEFQSEPVPGTTWSIVGGPTVPQQYSVGKISENGDDGSYTIEGIQYEPSKFDAIENNIPLTFLEVFGAENPYARPKPPQSLGVEESLFLTTRSSGVRVRADISWSHPNDFNNRAASFKIEYREESNPEWQIAGTSETRNFSIDDLAPGSYRFRITAISPNGYAGEAATTQAIIYGLTVPPASISGLTSEYFNGSLRLQWNRPPELDVKIGGQIQIYHTPITDLSASFDQSTLKDSIPGDETQIVMPPITGTYFVKVVDSSGNPSEDPAIAVFDGGVALNTNIVIELDESPLFIGAKDNVEVDSTLGILKISDTSLGQGIYEFSEIVDMNGSLVARISTELIAIGVNESETWDSAPGLFDSRPGLFDGNTSLQSSGVIQFQFSEDGITYSDWVAATGEFRRFRYCKLRLVMSTTDPAFNVYCYRLNAKFDVDDLIQQGSTTSSTSDDVDVTFDREFFTIPLVIGNIVNQASGDYFRLASVSRDGFSVSIYDSAGDRIEKDFIFFAKGY